MAVDLPQEEEVGRDELEEIRSLCEELRGEILACQTLNKTLREWLLDLVRQMREGIDDFRVRGSRGFRKRLYTMLGSMMVHYKDVEEMRKTQPGIWEKIMLGTDRLCRISDRYEKVKKGIGFAVQAISFLRGVASTLMLEGPGQSE